MKNLFIVLFVIFFSAIGHCSVLFEDDFNSYSSIGDLVSTGGWAEANNHAVVQSSGCYSGKCISVDYANGGNYPIAVSLGTHPREFWASFRFKVSSTPTGGIKFFKAFGKGYSLGNYANFTVNYGRNSSAESDLTAWSFGFGEGTQNDTQAKIDTGGYTEPYGYNDFTLVTPLIGGFKAIPGTWHRVIIMGRHSTGVTPPVNFDGEFKLIVDDIVYLHATALQNRGSVNQEGFERIALADYGNSYANMQIWYDDIKIGTSLSDVSFSGPAEVSLRGIGGAARKINGHLLGVGQ